VTLLIYRTCGVRPTITFRSWAVAKAYYSMGLAGCWPRVWRASGGVSRAVIWFINVEDTCNCYIPCHERHCRYVWSQRQNQPNLKRENGMSSRVLCRTYSLKSEGDESIVEKSVP